MSLSPKGTVFVGTMMDQSFTPIKRLYAVTNENKDAKADQVFTLADDLNVPNGVAYYQGDLFVAEINRIIRYDDIDEHLASPPAPVVVDDSYPEEMHHGWKYIRFGPDGRL